MGHSNVRIKARRRKVASLAGISRKYTVKNTNKSISPVIKHEKHYDDCSNAITCPFTHHKFVPTNPHPIPGRFGITITGYDWVEPEGKLWVMPQGGFKQTKSLRHSHKGYSRAYITGIWTKTIRKWPSEFPDYTIQTMNRVLYMERLVEHKVERWKRKHPQPIPENDEQKDMFEQQFMIPWKASLDAATEKFRDDVISIYDKLQLTGRFKISKKGTAAYQESLVAELKDINGDGHKVTHLNPKTSKLLQKAQDITNKIHNKNKSLVCTNLRDHKRKTGRIILPKAA